MSYIKSYNIKANIWKFYRSTLTRLLYSWKIRRNLCGKPKKSSDLAKNVWLKNHFKIVQLLIETKANLYFKTFQNNLSKAATIANFQVKMKMSEHISWQTHGFSEISWYYCYQYKYFIKLALGWIIRCGMHMKKN